MNIPVRVIPNFLSTVECAAWIDLINELEISRPEDFTVYKNEESYRLALQFGEKLYDSQQARPSLDVLGEKWQQAAGEIFSRVIESARQDLHPGELFTSVFWLAKQYPGSKINLHEDTDGGADSHLAVSSLVYLNSQSIGGELRFPKFDYTYKPQAGDLVLFDTLAAGLHAVDVIQEERYSLPMWFTRDEHFRL